MNRVLKWPPQAADRWRREAIALLSSSVIGSAFFLFLVQPLLAKQILPWFGGTAAVWAVCMVFYQATLLGGYLYAHGLIRWISPRRQAAIHLVVVALSLFALPVGVSELTRPELNDGIPGWQIVLLLLRAVGGPYFVLSATSPLVQAWYAQLEPGNRTYRLFGWSNLSCALALLCFPFLLEPWVPLSQLNILWSFGYGIWACLMAATALQVLRRRGRAASAEVVSAGAAPGLADHLRWLGLSALGCVLMISVTSHLCQTVAPIPFLWTVPLLLYLLSFVASFEREWYHRRWGMLMAAAAILAMVAALVYLPPGRMLGIGIPVFAGGCFLCCFFCHGELAARKPETAYLTQFYLILAAGGAIGSSLVAFLTPRIFRSYAELPVALSLCAVVILFSIYRRNALVDVAATICAVLATAPAFAYVLKSDGMVDAGRNFYGSLYVQDDPAANGMPALRRIVHGVISHGSQFLDPKESRRPTAYYGLTSAPGLCLASLKGPRRVGVIGLGAGTLAAYAKPGDRFRFYELNPLVAKYANEHFSYLTQARKYATVDVKLGDGRLLLESEPPQQFDMLVVDAFSGDSIPVHLLTREAFRVYRSHLKPRGVVALHLSNLYLDLLPVAARLAQDQMWVSVAVLDSGDAKVGTSPSTWAVIGSREALAGLPLGGRPVSTPSGPLWKDEHSSLLLALR